MINFLFSKLNFNEKWAKTALKAEICGHKKLAVLPFSYWDSEVYDCASWEMVYGVGGKYYQEILLPFSDYGIIPENIRYINYFADSEHTIKETLDWADILFLPGGAPDLFVERIINKNIGESLKSFSGVVIGCSAGAMIQLKKYHITPRQFYPRFEVLSGVGMIDMPLGVEVHYKANNEQLKSIDRVAEEYSSLILMDNKSGSMIKGNQITLLGNAKKIEFAR